MKGHKEIKDLLTGLHVLYSSEAITLELFRGSGTEKKPYNHFYSTEVKSEEEKMRDHAAIKSLIPGSPKWSALHKTRIKNECHSTNDLHVLCKIFIKDECHSMNSLHAA